MVVDHVVLCVVKLMHHVKCWVHKNESALSQKIKQNNLMGICKYVRDCSKHFFGKLLNLFTYTLQKIMTEFLKSLCVCYGTF